MREWKHDDRPAMPAGPWDNEPDKVQWVDEATGLDCLIHRGPAGALCGYVGVPPEHPLHGKDYEIPDIEVHGGLTYADACQENASEGHGICHIPEPGRPADVWWFGFDTAHCGDYCPRYDGDKSPRTRGNLTYRTIGYVKAECASLAKQLAAVGT